MLFKKQSSAADYQPTLGKTSQTSVAEINMVRGVVY